MLDPNLIPVQIGEKVGSGFNGEVFTIINDPNKVIKFSMIDNYRYSALEVLSFLKEKNDPAYARVYEYNKFIHNNYFILYYIMEKCHQITEDESKVFHSIISHEDRNYKKNFSLEKINNMLIGLSKGLDFDSKQVLNFIKNIWNSSIEHHDITPRNIMKKNNEEFCLVDFDLCNLKG